MAIANERLELWTGEFSMLKFWYTLLKCVEEAFERKQHFLEIISRKVFHTRENTLQCIFFL